MVDDVDHPAVTAALETALDGRGIDRTTAMRLLEAPVEAVASAAARVRAAHHDDTVAACSIVNAKAGGCPEDCGFCAQSAHYATDVTPHDVRSPSAMLDAAKRAAADGAQSFGVVIAGRGVSQTDRPEEFTTLLEAIALIDAETDLRIDASLGALTPSEAEALADAGVAVYNHNIETARRYFPEVVSTHTFADRIETLEIARAAGMALCAGVILGMGETPADRIDAAIALREIGIDSLPVNVLNPVDGTPIAEQVGAEAAITTAALRRTIAIYRLIHPRARIRLAGGREANVPVDDQHRLLEAGANGLLVGDYLTTDGQTPDRDRRIIKRAGLQLAGSE